MSKLMNEILFDNNYPKLHNQTAARLVFVLQDVPGKLLLIKYHGFMCYDCMRDDGLLYNINPDETYMLLLFVGNENIMFSHSENKTKKTSNCTQNRSANCTKLKSNRRRAIMGVSKEAKDKIISLTLQNIPADVIASELGYSVNTVRKVYEELREEYGVNTTKEIVNIYIDKELAKLNSHIENIRKLLKSSNFTTNQKSRQRLQKQPKRNKI